MSVFVQKVGLDFGETTVRFYIRDTDEYTEEKQSSLFLEFQRSRFRIRQSKGKNHPFTEMIDHGVIIDSDLLSAYLRFILSKAGLGKFALARIDLFLAVPTMTPKTTKQLWSQICERIGISKVTFVSCAIAGAVGAGYSFPIPTVALVVHLGHSSSEVAAVSLHECLFSTPLTLSGQNLYEQMRARFFFTAKQELTLKDWKKIETSLGAMLISDRGNKSALSEGSRKLEAVAVATVIEFGEELVGDIEAALEKLSVEELSLCSTQGIVLTGGLATQDGIAHFLSKRLSIPVYSASDPDMAVVRGTAELVSFLEKDEGR